MAIKRAKYWNNGNVIHFETDDRQVNILDNNKNTIGTLRELLFTGKQINEGSYKDIRHSGVYRVKGLKDLPDSVNAEQECILAVTAIGDNDDPDLILYRLISPNGTIVENTVSGTKSSGWLDGGVNLQNTIKAINSSLGNIASLQTKAKDLTGAINELETKFDKAQIENNKFKQEVNNKNYDSFYVSKYGDTVHGNLVLDKNASYQLFGKAGTRLNLGSVSSNGDIVIGESNTPLSMQGSSLKFNGSEIITTANVAIYAPDPMSGFSSGDFIKVNNDDTKRSNLTLSSNHHIAFDISGYDQSFIHLNKGTQKVGQFAANSQGSVTYSAGNASWTFDANNQILYQQHTGGITLDNKRDVDPEARITWRRLNDNGNFIDAGIWLCQPQWGDWTDNEKNHTTVWYNGRTNQNIVQYGYGNDGEAVKVFHAPYVGEQGSRVFVQDAEPKGDIPYGSIWIGF